MPKFHFNIADNIVLEDSEGTELPDLAAARRHAHAVAVELMHHREGMLGQLWPDWTMIVKNDKGDEVYKFRINEADGASRH